MDLALQNLKVSKVKKGRENEYSRKGAYIKSN